MENNVNNISLLDTQHPSTPISACKDIKAAVINTNNHSFVNQDPMAQQEDFRPPLFDGNNFGCWKVQMEHQLKTQTEIWAMLQTGRILPTEEDALIAWEKGDTQTVQRFEADAKATYTIMCGLTNSELDRVGPFSSAKELWEKLIELYEDTTDPKESAITWNEMRREWLGDSSKRWRRRSEPSISWLSTYDDLLSTTQPFPQAIPLWEMVDFLVDIWHEEGLYD